jgi:hypothetical protein
VTGEWRKLRNEELHSLSSSIKYIRPPSPSYWLPGSPDPDPIPHWSGQGSALTVSYISKPNLRERLTHRPDDGGSKDL